MGMYYNPPSNLPKVARHLQDSWSYLTLVAQLQPGERLFGHYDRFIFQNAAYLDNQAEFDRFEDQVKQGTIARRGYYAMSAETFAKTFPLANEPEQAPFSKENA